MSDTVGQDEAGDDPSRWRKLATFAALLVASFSVMATSKLQWHQSAKAKSAPVVVSPAASKTIEIISTVTPSTSKDDPITGWRLGFYAEAKPTPKGAQPARVRLTLQPSKDVGSTAEAPAPGPEPVRVGALEYLSSLCTAPGPCERRMRLLIEGLDGPAELEPEITVDLRGGEANPPPGASVAVRLVPVP